MEHTASIDIETRLKHFVYENFPVAKSMGLSGEENLLESGAVDSMGLLTVISFIEDEFVVQVSDDDVVMENFGSISAIARYIQSQLS